MNLKDDMTGAALLADWLGEGGKPVEPMEAEFRAQHCVTGNQGKPCDMNCEPNWWELVKSTIADWIRGELELKNGMDLKVSVEDELFMCRLCGCCLRLKVHTPDEVLKRHVNKAKLETAPRWCWMRKLL